MDTRIKALQSRTFGFMVLLVILICSACAPGGTASSTPTSPPPAPKLTSIVHQQPLTGPVTYVALGASDAVGVGSNQPGSQGYVPLLAQRLPQGSHLINLGVSGIHLHEALNEELPIALSTSPKLVTIWLVANDFIANVPYNNYTQDLNTLLTRLRAGTQARIIMANLPNLTLLPIFAGLNAQKKSSMLTAIKRWNSSIANIAAHYNVTVVDLLTQEASALTSQRKYISSDGFHPSPAGYVQLADFFWQAIKS